MKNKIFTIIFMLLFIFTSSVFAVNLDNDTLNSDIYKLDSETYSLDSEVSGNVFICSGDFEMLDTSSLEGNLYVACDTAHLKSNVTYSNAISKDGSYSIESVNSHATVNGNVFIICDEFILEPGSEINGDLYILANKIDIQKSSSIYGNLFAVSSEILLNGRVSNSVYATSSNFKMNYYGSIGKDLHLTAENVTLSSVIHRNTYMTSENITTTSDFLLYGNLESNSHEFNFSGQIDGNATINSKKINFINNNDDSKIECLISGNLNYSSEEEIQIDSNIVTGKINYSEHVEKTDNKFTFNFKSFVMSLITFVVYVLAVVLVFNLLNKNYQNIKHKITVKNTFASLGLGILSFILVSLALVLLITIEIGITLSLALLFAYIFLLFLSIPTLILDTALLLKAKLNLYLKVALITLALYIISSIPVLGGLVMFVVLMTGARKNLP